MTLKIKTPPMPEPHVWGGGYTPEQLAARDAQWLELVGPVVEALKQSLDECIYPSAVISDVYEKASAALRAISIAAPLLTECNITEEQE